MDNDNGVRFSTGAPPTATYETPAMTAPVPARRSITPAVLTVVAVASLGIGFGAGYAAHSGSGPSKQAAAASTSPSQTGATVIVHGNLTLGYGNFVATNAGTGCAAGDGYSDISAGTAVTIGDQTGATIAVGQLDPGRQDGSGCSFGFDVQAPAGRTSYTITVSHRGTQVFSPDQISEADMTLG